MDFSHRRRTYHRYFGRISSQRRMSVVASLLPIHSHRISRTSVHSWTSNATCLSFSVLQTDAKVPLITGDIDDEGTILTAGLLPIFTLDRLRDCTSDFLWSNLSSRSPSWQKSTVPINSVGLCHPSCSLRPGNKFLPERLFWRDWGSDAALWRWSQLRVTIRYRINQYPYTRLQTSRCTFWRCSVPSTHMLIKRLFRFSFGKAVGTHLTILFLQPLDHLFVSIKIPLKKAPRRKFLRYAQSQMPVWSYLDKGYKWVPFLGQRNKYPWETI